MTKVTCQIICDEHGAISIEFTGPFRGKEGRIELLKAAIQIIEQGT